MAFDGIVTKQIIHELNTCLINGKINKVFQPSKNEIILGIYSGGKNYALLININSSSCRIHLTTNHKPNPVNALNFCMLLRKHLIGMKIKNISNFDLERIITLELEGYNELNDFITKKLIVELMGKHGNIILVNENNNIIDALRHIEATDTSLRNILPARPYSLPSTSKHSFLKITSFEEFYNVINNSNENIINSIANSFTGISKLSLQYIIQKLNINTNNSSDDNLRILYNYIKKITLTSSLECIPYNIGKKRDYVIDISNKVSELYNNFFIDDFYNIKEIDDNFKNYRNSILKIILAELKKYTKRLNNINSKLKECDNMDLYKTYGELITANLYKINNDVNLDKLELENYYDNLNRITIPLDRTISPAYNAKKYFKKYNKLKNALEIVSVQKKETADEIDYIESIIYEIENAKDILELHAIYEEISENIIFKNTLSKINTTVKKKNKVNKKKNEFDKSSFLTFNIDNYTIYVGKNNKQNDYLSLKFAHNNDLWFHTKDVHGSHVILKTNGDEVEQDLINKCASIAAYYSKASSSSNVCVDYTYVRYVKKPHGAKPGMVIYTNYETVNVKPTNFNLANN